MKKKSTNWLLIGVVALFAIIILGNSGALSNLGLPNYEGNPNPYPYATPTPTPYNPWPTAYPTSAPTSAPYTDVTAPTSLFVVVEPNPMNMGAWVGCSVTSNGRNSPFDLHIKNVGSGQEQSVGGFLDEDGQFYHGQTFSIPGYWDVWATTGSVTSNKPRLQVQGALVVAERTHVSKTVDDTLVCQLFCHSSGNTQVFLNDPAHSASIPMTNAVINSGGYGDIELDFGSIANGDYTISFVVNGVTADSYGGVAAVTVGR